MPPPPRTAGADTKRRRRASRMQIVQHKIRSPRPSDVYRTRIGTKPVGTTSSFDTQSTPPTSSGKRDISHELAPYPFFVPGGLNALFLLIAFASHARPLIKVVNSLDLRWGRVHDVVLRGASLECSLSFLEVASVVLRAYQGEDNDVGGHGSDEDGLDECVVWHILRAIRPLDCGARAFSTS